MNVTLKPNTPERTELMQLYIRVANKIISLEVENANTTVKEVKSLIFEAENIPIHQQCLMYLDDGGLNYSTRGQASQCILNDDELTLSDYNVTNGVTLLLKVDEGESTMINVQCTLGRAQTTLSYLRGSTKIGELKCYYFDKFGVPEDRQRLICGPRELHDKHTLHYYNIRNDNQLSLHLVSKVIGGSNFYDLVSECPGCPGIGSCAMLIKCEEISHIENASNNAWSALCNTFNIKESVIKIIAENSDSPAVRCADTVHRLFHADRTLTWNNIKVKLEQCNLHLTEEI